MSEINSDFFRLRKEIRLDDASLHDRLTGATYRLDVVGRAVVDAVRAHLKAGELVREVVGVCGASPARVERELRQMVLLGLFEDTCGESRKRLQRILSGERLAFRVLEGSRFGCQNSGACCRGYVFGTIREEEKRRIETLDPRKELPELGDTPLFVEAGVTSGKPSYRLGTSGDACVFLEAGPRCGLHRAFGASAKPALCQLYPLAAVATIEGLKIYDRGECATFAVSSNTGTLLEEDMPRIRALVDEDVYHPTAQVYGSWRCDYGLILALARRLDKEANSQSPLQALHAIGHVARHFVVTLTRCPFEVGQPEADVAAALGCSTEEFRPSEATVAANARAGLRALVSLSQGLVERVAPQEALAPFFKQTASLLAQICHSTLSEEPASERVRSAVAISMGGDSERAIRLSLRQQLFGRELLLDDQLPAGLLRMALVVTLTLAGARLRALDDGQNQVLPRHLSASHMTIKRTLHRPEPHGLLRVNGEQTWCILDALPLLAGHLGFNASIPQS
jgi:Fe-S-cluster containining protein